MTLPWISLEAGLHELTDRARVVTAMAAAEPQSLFARLADRARQLQGMVVYCANPSREYECFTADDLIGHLELRVLFLTGPVRKYHGHDTVHYIPQHLSLWTRNLLDDGPVDVFWGSCSEPDARGYVSLGVSCCYESEMVRAARIVILEVNPRIPFTYGSTLVPVSWVTGLIKSEHRLPTLSKPEISEEDRAIAGHVAELIEDGSTLQFGIGGIPNALGAILEQRRDLGIHTEMINDTIMHLCQSGAVNGRLKSIWPGRTVGAFAFGSEDLYEFCHHNAGLEFHPASVVNDRDRIGRNTKMISINTAVEVDLTGQVCSESVGHRELSGVGGATDTHVGAQRSSGGKGIVALRSRNAKTDESKIVFELKPGAKVSISRNDIDTVVTEYGVAKLRGRTVAQRVREMVGIAHPDEREELLRQARGCGYL